MKEEMEITFNWWITCIPDKINFLKKYIEDFNLNINIVDYSLESLNQLESYLIENYSIESIKSDEDLFDSIASYIGTVYKKNIPQSKWFVELNDTKYIYFNKPELIVEKLTSFQPHSYITTAIDRKKGDLWSTVILKHLNYIDNH